MNVYLPRDSEIQYSRHHIHLLSIVFLPMNIVVNVSLIDRIIDYTFSTESSHIHEIVIKTEKSNKIIIELLYNVWMSCILLNPISV